MVGWPLCRIGQTLLVVLVMTVIVFIGLHAIGNLVDILIGQNVDQINRACIIAELGLDKPLWEQHLVFLNGALHGNLGKSFVYNEPVTQLILQRLPVTPELAFSALTIAVVIGVLLGLFAGLYPRHPASRLLVTGSMAGFSLPAFWMGLMLIMVFSMNLGWLSVSGCGETVRLFGIEWSWLTVDELRHLMLPAVNLLLFKLSLVLRLISAGAHEVLPLDFMEFARAKGLSPLRVVLAHVLRNTLVPLVTMLGLELGSTIAFAVATESIFVWPGAGKLVLDSINSLDRPVIVSYLIVVVYPFVLLNLIVDILYRLPDPRIRAADGAETA